MLESLDINGRTYIASDAAALEVGYPTSYIERLARGKWIDASYVQGQCFVDIASLMEFVAATERDKEAQLLSALMREKAESALARYEERQRRMEGLAGEEVVILGKTGIIAVCGLLLAILSFSVVRSDVELTDISMGMNETLSLLNERIVMPAGLWWSMFLDHE